MERQSVDVRKKCTVCSQPLQSCICDGVAMLSLPDRPMPAGLAATMQQRSPVTDKVCSTIGSIVGERYELVEELGCGGMGSVFKARHVALPKLFAVKLLKAALSDDTDFRARPGSHTPHPRVSASSGEPRQTLVSKVLINRLTAKNKA